LAACRPMRIMLATVQHGWNCPHGPRLLTLSKAWPGGRVPTLRRAPITAAGQPVSQGDCGGFGYLETGRPPRRRLDRRLSRVSQVVGSSAADSGRTILLVGYDISYVHRTHRLAFLRCSVMLIVDSWAARYPSKSPRWASMSAAMARSTPAKRTASGRLLGSREPMPARTASRATTPIGLLSHRAASRLVSQHVVQMVSTVRSCPSRWIRAWRSLTEITLDPSSAVRPHCV